MEILKKIEKITMYKSFIAAEKWMDRSNGLNGFISPQNGTVRR